MATALLIGFQAPIAAQVGRASHLPPATAKGIGVYPQVEFYGGLLQRAAPTASTTGFASLRFALGGQNLGASLEAWTENREFFDTTAISAANLPSIESYLRSDQRWGATASFYLGMRLAEGTVGAPGALGSDRPDPVWEAPDKARTGIYLKGESEFYSVPDSASGGQIRDRSIVDVSAFVGYYYVAHRFRVDMLVGLGENARYDTRFGIDPGTLKLSDMRVKLAASAFWRPIPDATTRLILVRPSGTAFFFSAQVDRAIEVERLINTSSGTMPADRPTEILVRVGVSLQLVP
jgi:hypothetical protein